MKILCCAAATLLVLGIAQGHPQEKPKQQDSKKTEDTKKPRGSEKTRRKRVVTNLAGFDLLEPSKLEKQTMVVGASRGLAHPVALAPRLGKLYGGKPVFAWTYEGNAEKFVFVLRDDAETEVFRGEASGTEFHYPADAPSLQPGKTYFWTVEVPSAFLGATSSAPVGFLVVSPSQREEIEKKLAEFAGDSYEASLSRARVFTDSRLWYDALAAYTQLIERYPDRAELYEQRGTIYEQFDVTQKLAGQDFNRADGLPVREK